MVDASAIDLPRGRADQHEASRAEAVLDCSLSAFDGAAIAAYSRFAAANPGGPHQSPVFLQAWQEATGAEMLLAAVRADGREATLIPLEVTSSALCRTAGFPGGTHANGNMAPIRPDTASGGPAIAAALREALRRERPDIDLLALERMASAIGGTANPLVSGTADISPDIALSTRLDGGFEALLDRSGGKRKRKKYRAQLRKYESAGGWRIVSPASGDEVNRLLDAFLAMKAVRFARMGIPNVFAGPGCEAFLRRLYCDALSSPVPAFELRGLEVGGKLRAVTGCSISGTRMICDISAMASDDLSSASPGEFLFYETIREACERGFDVFDFSVGDEQYKRVWCDTETRQFDHFIALTGRGAAVATVVRSFGAMKRALKSNPALWSIAKRLRRGAGGRELASGTGDH